MHTVMTDLERRVIHVKGTIKHPQELARLKADLDDAQRLLARQAAEAAARKKRELV